MIYIWINLKNEWLHYIEWWKKGTFNKIACCFQRASSKVIITVGIGVLIWYALIFNDPTLITNFIYLCALQQNKIKIDVFFIATFCRDSLRERFCRWI